MTEHDIQNSIRLALSKNQTAICWRANVGQAWTGDGYIREGRSVIITNARPFVTGLPNGFSDLFGVVRGGQAFFLEVKSERGRPSDAQLHFLEVARQCGALTGIVHNPEEALSALRIK